MPRVFLDINIQRTSSNAPQSSDRGELHRALQLSQVQGSAPLTLSVQEIERHNACSFDNCNNKDRKTPRHERAQINNKTS